MATSAPEFLKLLAHDLRWQLVTALTASDLRVQELVAQVNRPVNLVSYHLKQLRDSRLVHEHRSSADGRDIYYSLDLARVADLYQSSGLQLHPALVTERVTARGTITAVTRSTDTTDTPARVLFLCTHNSARSQMAEGLLRAYSKGTLAVFSAGNQPGSVHPQAIATMADLGIDIHNQRAKHLDEFRNQSFDLIITVCDQLREQCPTFPSDPHQIHWSIADPTTVDVVDMPTRFAETAQLLQTRIKYLLLSHRFVRADIL